MKKMDICCLLLSVMFFVFGCSKNENVKEIDFEKAAADHKGQSGQEKALRVAVGAMVTPKEGFAYYRQFLDYLSERLGTPVEYVDRSNYAEINGLMKEGKIDVAFVCSNPYVEGHKEFGMELLVAPVAFGKTVYHSYIIVNKNSAVSCFKELRGKSFAFTDPMSNTGKLVPVYMLARMNETPDSFFKKHLLTYGHDKSIKAVAEGIADGAAVDSLIWEYARARNSDFVLKTKVIERSPPYGIPPVVVRPGIDPLLKEKIRQVFLEAHNDGKGRAILQDMAVDRFTVVKDDLYDSIRAMAAWTDKNK